MRQKAAAACGIMVLFSAGGGHGVKQTIYVDVLMAVNFFINYYLLLACAAYLRVPVRRGRLAASSALGALFSLAILLPELPAVLSAAEKLLMSAGMVLSAFGFVTLKEFLRRTAAFFLISFSFAGLMIALWYFVSPQGMAIRNTVVYFNISPAALILLAAACYGILRLVSRFAGRAEPKNLFCRAEITRGSVCCSFTARVDTGNSLTEPFSGDPVAVVSKAAAERVIPPEGSANFRLVPFHTVSGGGLLRAFRPDRLVIHVGDKKIVTGRVYIAITENRLEGCDALLNPDLLQQAPKPEKRRGERI